ncbi:MAG: hypothetical protein HC837_20425, partial [Chloroflexaceae bacterium]|nr:hypothetical protein [Chloroflexaceae bacterium]
MLGASLDSQQPAGVYQVDGVVVRVGVFVEGERLIQLASPGVLRSGSAVVGVDTQRAR